MESNSNAQNSEITLQQLFSLDGGEFILEDNPQTPPQPGFVMTEPGEEDKDLDNTSKEGDDNPDDKEIKEGDDNTPPVNDPAKSTPAPIAGHLEIAKAYLEAGKWQDVILEIDGKEVKLSELDSIDKETFLAIEEEQNAIKEEELKNDYVSVKDIDENRKRLINIIKNGGDLKEIFQSETALKRPFEGIDLSKPETQMSIVYSQYKKQGLSDGEAKDLTEKAAKELTLDSKVESIVKYYQTQYDTNLVEREKQIAEERKAEEAAIKEYRKSLSTFYKEEGLAESLSKRLVDAATKKDENGTLVIDSIYEKLMQDPKEAKELVFFLLEKENYLKTKGATIKANEQLEMMKRVKIIRDTSGKTNAKEEKVEESKNPFGEEIILGE